MVKTNFRSVTYLQSPKTPKFNASIQQYMLTADVLN